MKRFSFEEYACLQAISASSRSEDPYTQVGACILSKTGRVLSSGYNGLAPKKKVKQEFWEDRNLKNLYVFHAEQNACDLIGMHEGQIIGLTHSPCQHCATRLVSKGIKKVVYLQEYHREQLYKDIFAFYGVEHFLLSKESKKRIQKFLKESALKLT